VQFNFSLSDEEHLRYNGTLPLERQEAIIGDGAHVAEIQDAACYITDALAQFPDEDFLTEVIREIEVVENSVRGENKKALRAVIEKLTDMELAQARATEEAVDLLGKLTTIIEGT
jgi:hypothetical protein